MESIATRTSSPTSSIVSASNSVRVPADLEVFFEAFRVSDSDAYEDVMKCLKAYRLQSIEDLADLAQSETEEMKEAFKNLKDAVRGTDSLPRLFSLKRFMMYVDKAVAMLNTPLPLGGRAAPLPPAFTRDQIASAIANFGQHRKAKNDEIRKVMVEMFLKDGQLHPDVVVDSRDEKRCHVRCLSSECGRTSISVPPRTSIARDKATPVPDLAGIMNHVGSRHCGLSIRRELEGPMDSHVNKRPRTSSHSTSTNVTTPSLPAPATSLAASPPPPAASLAITIRPSSVITISPPTSPAPVNGQSAIPNAVCRCILLFGVVCTHIFVS